MSPARALGGLVVATACLGKARPWGTRLAATADRLDVDRIATELARAEGELARLGGADR